MALPNQDHLQHTLATLRVITYDAWGSTSPTPLPVQVGEPQVHDVLARQLVRGLVAEEPSIARMEDSLVQLFCSRHMKGLIDDTFWLMFLEYFALIDGVARMERHKKLIVSQYEEEEFASSQNARSRNNSRTYFLRRKNAERLQRRGSTVGQHARSAEDSDSPGRKPARDKDGRKQQQGPELALDDDGKIPHTPRHLADPRRHTGPPGSERPGSPCEMRSPSRLTSRPASAATSRPSSRAESLDSVMAASVDDPFGATTLLKQLMEEPPDAYEGKCEINAAIAVLKSAGIMDDMASMESTMGGRPRIAGVDEQSAVRQQAVFRAAIDLIRQEQEHMFGRISRCYVAVFRSISSVKRDVVLGPFPDALAQLISRVLFRVLPYMRAELTPTQKKLMKRRVTYWFAGVENGDTRRWATVSQAQALLMSPLLSAQRPSNAGFQTSTSPRGDTSLDEARGAASIMGASSAEPAALKLPSIATVGAQQASSANLASSREAAATSTIGRWRQMGSKAKNTNHALQMFAEAGDMHRPVFSEAYLQMRKEMRAVLSSGAPPAGPPTAETRVAPAPPAPPSAHSPAPPPPPATARGADTGLVAPPPAPGGSLTGRPSVRHVQTHRYASDPRPPRWHELGRRREARLLAHDNACVFEATSVTPLMARYLSDHDTPRYKPYNRMSWLM